MNKEVLSGAFGEVFKGSFTQQEPIPEAGIEAAVAVLRHGRLHRYNTAAGEVAEAVLLEQEFAALVGAKYCLAVASGGYALGCALRAVGMAAGAPVLTNAFTLAPVPGAIAAAGGQPIFIETTPDLTIDMGDLAAKAQATGARILMLSHMRGHICDMDALVTLCAGLGVQIIEDCAHTMGASWRGTPSGRHGIVGCYSMQTYKHINAGEGGFLISDNAEIMARATLLSGSYMLYFKHLAGPDAAVYEDLRLHTPNVSCRMDNLRAAILRPQLPLLEGRVARWQGLYRVIETGLHGVTGLVLPHRPQAEHFAPSSFQFRLPNWSAARIGAFLSRCLARGVELKWFGADRPVAFTSRYDHWAYAGAQSCPKTDAVLAGLIDMRLPLTFSEDDAAQISRIIRAEALAVGQGPEPEALALPVIQ